MTLELPADRMRELGYRVVDMLVDRYAGLRETRAWTGATRHALDERLHEPPPAAPGDVDAALRRIFDDVLPYGASVDHPRFMAFVPGAGTWPGVLGDFIAAGADVFQGTWLASSGTSALELVVLDWFRLWLGYDDDAAGLLVSGGSAANLTAIACARISRFGAHDDRAVIYCSSETHSSVLRAARVLGFAETRVRELAADDAQRLRVDDLARAMDADAEAGLVPFIVAANAGTTSTGAVDPLDGLADLCAARNAWLHVDAAYGGFAVLTARGRSALAGIERADSITLDPHKWLYQPFEVGCLLVRRGYLLDQAFHVMPDYLQDTALPDGAGPDAPRLPVNFANRGIQLTRSARALKLWLSIQTFGIDAFRDAIDRCMDLALVAEHRIERSSRLELLTPAHFGIVCFRIRAGDADAVNNAAVRALLQSGIGMISSTRVNGVFALRLCILNYRTDARDVAAVLDWIEEFDAAEGAALIGSDG
ncbi:MAG: aminotransferase class V-fold PLP-dependent enzyme [Gemmatimonadota bacterium]